MMNEAPARRPRLQQSGLLREIVETVILIGLVYTLVNLATVRFYIEGPSMQPNFHADQFLIVSRLHYLLGSPQRGEIIVFDPPGDDNTPNNPLLIKRVIGTPGDVIEIHDGQVSVNGVDLYEPYIFEPCTTSTCNDSRWELGANEYFMMGDNRNNSRDSRAFGPIVRERIIGEAIIRYWPPTDIGIVTRYHFPE